MRYGRNWTQEELAKRCGWKSLSVVHKIETGKNISDESLRKLASVFDISILTLIYGENPPELLTTT